MYPTKLLAFVYWILSEFFIAMYDDGYSDWKALVIICCTQIAGIIAVFLCYQSH